VQGVTCRSRDPCHDAFDRTSFYADVSWLASDAITSMRLKKGNATLCRSRQSNANIVSTLLLTYPTDMGIHLQQLQNGLRARLTQAKMPHRGVVLPSPWSRANYSTPDCHRSAIQKREFDCFSVTATSCEANSSQKTGVIAHAWML
jgi:hypothetical protein